MELRFEDMFSATPPPQFSLLDDGEATTEDEAIEIDPKKSKVGLEDFELLKLVGEGGYGKVYQVQQKTSGTIYAMKVLRKNFLISTNNVEYTKTERDVLRMVRHPFIVSLHYAFQTEGKLYLLMDYMNGGQLFYHLRNEAMFEEDQIRIYAAEIVLAIEHLHKLGIIHRDLKPENILLDGDGHVAITDFGLAKEIRNDDERTHTFCGTLEYMSPEMIRGGGYTKSTDWWSVGVLLFDMLTGKPPFTSKNEGVLQKLILAGKFKLPSYTSPEACSLIKGLMQTDPEKRFGVKEIKSHPFFKKLNWKKVLNKEVPPPFRPKIERGKLDTSNFDSRYTNQKPVDSPASPPMLTKSMENLFAGFTYVRSPNIGVSPVEVGLREDHAGPGAG